MDFDLIKGQVWSVINNNNVEKDFKVDKLMDKWLEAKMNIVEEWGGKLQIELKENVVITKTAENKRKEFEKFMADCYFYSMDYKIKQFLELQGIDAFYKNTVIKEYREGTVYIKKGMKISKALKSFVGIKDCLEYLQNRYSMIIQSIKVTGTLCASIHPLDFLSISENNCNWRSCHSLDGEYKAGNLSYMMDKSTIVVYLKSEEPVQLERFPKDLLWNNKKWRCLFFMNEERDLIINSKPYPFFNSELLEKSYELIKSIYPNNWKDSIQNFDEYNEELCVVLEDEEFSLHFNDCIDGTEFDPQYLNTKEKDILDCQRIIVGGPVPCLKCEQTIVECSEDYTCFKCGDYIVCEECGEYASYKDIYEVDGKQICTCCYDEGVELCTYCGALHLVSNKQIRHVGYGNYVCKDCEKNPNSTYNKIMAQNGADLNSI